MKYVHCNAYKHELYYNFTFTSRGNLVSLAATEKGYPFSVCDEICLKGHRGLASPDCQHVVIDEFLCMVSCFALETDVCHWMFKTKLNMVQGQEDSALNQGLFT